MKGNRKTLLFFVCFSLIFFCAASPLMAETSPVKPVSFRFGTLPVIQALPLFVADEKGFFAEAGIDVTLDTFPSAMEKDMALSTGEIAGYFGDMLTPITLRANGVLLTIVATNFTTPGEQRMFALVAAPKYTEETLETLIQEGVARAPHTLLDYLMAKMLVAADYDGKIALIDIVKIPLRLQMLLTSQVPAALLPEPLVTFAVTKGCRVVADDASLGVSATILAFTDDFIAVSPKTVRAFLGAVNRASLFINASPGEARRIMNRTCRIPAPLADSFPLPLFPEISRPRKELVMDVYRWLTEQKYITKELTYDDIVSHEPAF